MDRPEADKASDQVNKQNPKKNTFKAVVAGN